jgi:hypothetical protein
VQPTVLTETKPEMSVVTEEIFVAVVCAIPFVDDDLDSIARSANDTSYGHGEKIENSLSGEYFFYTLKESIGVVGAIIPWSGLLGATIWKVVRRPQDERLGPRSRHSAEEGYLNIKAVWIKTAEQRAHPRSRRRLLSKVAVPSHAAGHRRDDGKINLR